MTEIEQQKPATYANYPHEYGVDFLFLLARAAEVGADEVTISHQATRFFAAGRRLFVPGYGPLDATAANGMALAALVCTGRLVDEFRVLTRPQRAEARADFLYLGRTVRFEVRTRPHLAAGARMTVEVSITLRAGPLE